MGVIQDASEIDGVKKMAVIIRRLGVGHVKRVY